MTRPRIDPFAVSTGVGAHGRRRIDRSGETISVPPVRPKPESRSVRVIDEPSCLIAVVIEGESGKILSSDRHTLAAAHLLTGDRGAVLAICFGTCPEGLGNCGADRVIRLPAPDGGDADACVTRLAELLKTLPIRHMLFPQTAASEDLARRLTALIRESIAYDAISLTENLLVQRTGAGREVWIKPPAIIIVAHDLVEVDLFEDGEALPMTVNQGTSNQPRVRFETPLRPAPNDVALAEADAILAGGNGVKDWAALFALGDALGLPIGASRVAVDAGRVSRSHQIGSSGAIATARTYLAFGISGAPQHLEGIRTSEAVLAVNLDPQCAMMQRADLAIVADADAVVQALCRAIGRTDG